MLTFLVTANTIGFIFTIVIVVAAFVNYAKTHGKQGL